jgi:NAD-dependent DNA ligase
MTDQAPEQHDQTEWPTHCPVCGTALSSAVIDFDKTNADHNELRPGEMVAVDYCPNPDCPAKRGEPPTGAGPA